MAGKCSEPSCFPDDTGCNVEGCDKVTDCKYYNKGSIHDNQNIIEEDEYMLRIPWTANSLGLEDLNYITASTSTVLIGITGVANAGKSTFLALLYCLLRHGDKIGDFRFSGSKTLVGWENIAWYLSWKTNNDIQFPPHTSSNSGRVPGLLHLTLRNSSGIKKDLVFTDAPGEWFDKWAYSKDDVNAEGANWIHDNADAFLLFADCELLQGEEQGKSRRQIRLVAERLSEGLRNRPLGLVWSKSDVDLDGDMRKQLTSYMGRFNNLHYGEFSVSIKEDDEKNFHSNILKSIEWILVKLENNSNPKITVPIYKNEDLFISKRSYNGAK